MSNKETFETFDLDFQPIRGYPELRWAGKKPFQSTHFFPAQLKETHGDPVGRWWNRLYWGDNLQVMSHLLREFRGKIDLIYIDPPFDSGADYTRGITIKGRTAQSSASSFEEKQYTDIWTSDTYSQFIYERMILCRELLSDTGSIYVHMNHDKSHHVRCIMDEVFGPALYRNDIAWHRGPGKSHPEYFGRVKDTILFYTKTKHYIWNKQFKPLAAKYVASFNKEDSRGKYVTQPLHSGRPAKHVPEWKGALPPEGRGWAYKISTLEEFDAQGLIEWSNDRVPRLKRYLDDVEGTVIQDVWDDISPVLSRSQKYLNYPTQKPEELVQRIIETSTNSGDLIMDCFMGSGTTQAVAMKTGRRFIGADINLGSIETTISRLLKVQIEMQKPDLLDENSFLGFQVFNVNNYDIFRNPVEAKELIKEAMELQPLPTTSTFDGQRDQQLVKIMPVNRIATKADLNEVQNGLNFKAFERRQAESPSKAVERVMLVCMGHEPDIGLELVKLAKPFDIEVEVVDLIRDKANLHFKRQSDARLVIEDGHLVVSGFLPTQPPSKTVTGSRRDRRLATACGNS